MVEYKHGGRFYIAVDLEGIAGVIGQYGKGLAGDTPGYAYACKQATREANEAATALFECGATEVWVWDCHGTGYNLNYDNLNPNVKIVMGAGSGKRFPGIESGFDGVLFIGYHAYDVPAAVLSHVYSSTTFQYQKINGEFVGEAQIDGAIAGKYGAPVIFLSSDNVCVEQAKKTFKGIYTVETKTSLAWNSCVSKHPNAVCNEIYETVKKAALDIESFEPYTIKGEFEYEMRYKRMEYAEGCRLHSTDGKLFERVDAYTVRGTLADPEDIF